MFRNSSRLVFLISFCLLFACKSEFESIRTSNDPELMYKKAVEYFDKKEYSKTQTLFESIVSSFRGKKEFEQLNYMFAYTYYYQKDYSAAASAFKNFANTFTYSPYKEEMDYMYAYSLYQQSPNFRLDQEPSQKAVDALQAFVNTYPKSERVKEANDLLIEIRQKLEEKAFASGEQYYNMGQWQAAITTLANVVREFPDSKNVEKMRYLMAKAAFTYAEHSVFEKKEERYTECMNYAHAFISKHPKSKYKGEVQEFASISKSKINQIKHVGYQKQSAGSGS